MALAPLPPDAIPARIAIRRINGESTWYADFEEGGVPQSRIVGKKDAWNFDIERNLQVWILLLPDDACRVVRKKGNKKYVQI